jgi:hypothetical protein
MRCIIVEKLLMNIVLKKRVLEKKMKSHISMPSRGMGLANSNLELS